jgi:hypothetical protein
MKTKSHLNETCPRCDGRVLPVMYGMPDEEGMKASQRGEFILGGCTLEDVACRCGCGATSYTFDEVDDVDEEFGFDEARAYIAEVRWQFAKTMPQWPHEYTVRDWRPELEGTFEAFAGFTRSEGVVKPWPADSPTPRYHHRYVEIDGWDYWIMDGPIEETGVINRARLDGTLQPPADLVDG